MDNRICLLNGEVCRITHPHQQKFSNIIYISNRAISYNIVSHNETNLIKVGVISAYVA